MDPPSCDGNDDQAKSGENSAQEFFWTQQEVIDSSGLPSDACLLAYLQAQGTGMMKDPSNQVSSGAFTDHNLFNASVTHKLYSDILGQHYHAFDQQQLHGKAGILGPQQREESHSNNLMNHQGSKRQLDTYLQTHSSAGFQSSDHWGSGDGGKGLMSSSSLNHHKMMFEAAGPTTPWPYGETDFGSSGGGHFLGRTSVNSFQQYSSHSNELMTMKDKGLGPTDTRAEPLVGHLTSLPGRAQVLTTGSSTSHALPPLDWKEGEQTSITTSQQGASKIDGSCFEQAHETNAFAGPFEPRWGSARRPEDFQGQPDLSLAGMTTRLSNLQGIFCSSYQSDIAPVATAPLLLPVDNGAPSSSPPDFMESFLQQSITPTIGDFAGGSSLPPRHMVANEAMAADLVHHLKMQQNARMQELLRVPRGMPITVGSTPPVPENSALTHLPEQYKQLDEEADLKVSASTLIRATSSTGIGAWSEASAELLGDLEMLTREKSSHFKKKITNKPKRPLSAYNIFFKEERERILREIPDDATTLAPSASSQGLINSRIRKGKRAPHGKIDFQSLAKAVGKRWQNLSAEAMAEYKEKANDDLARYKREMDEFTKTARIAFEEEFSDLKRQGER